ncbi:hypothetical protein VNO77_14731 [Canavalia gladiata]|uniref:Uncharacterized protein n=1 Tax=Canavalia gladiata TaxID=3824 RepID=A0AAN9LZM2_CANGL
MRTRKCSARKPAGQPHSASSQDILGAKDEGFFVGKKVRVFILSSSFDLLPSSRRILTQKGEEAEAGDEVGEEVGEEEGVPSPRRRSSRRPCSLR